MSSNAVRQILETRLNDQWAGATPITWDNVNRVATIGREFISCDLTGVFSTPMSTSCQRESCRAPFDFIEGIV